jgi:hypothetical protein
MADTYNRILDPSSRAVKCYVTSDGLKAIPIDDMNKDYQELSSMISRDAVTINDVDDSY